MANTMFVALLLMFFLAMEKSHAWINQCSSLRSAKPLPMMNSIGEQFDNTPLQPQPQPQTQTQTKPLPNRREALCKVSAALSIAMATAAQGENAWAEGVGIGKIDRTAMPIEVNYATASDFMAFPGLYPGIAGKILSGVPYKSKEGIYAVVSDSEKQVLRKYDKYLIIKSSDGQDAETRAREVASRDLADLLSF